MSKIDEIRKKLEEPEHLVKKAKILYDGKQFMIKIPKEISELYHIKKGYSFVFDITIPHNPNEEIISNFAFEKDGKKEKRI